MGEKPKGFPRSFVPLTDPKWSQVVQIVVADYDYSSAIGAVGLLPDGQVITWKNEHQLSHPKTLFQNVEKPIRALPPAINALRTMDHRIVPFDGEAFFTSNLTQTVDPLTEMGCDPDAVAIYGANCQMLPDGTLKLLTYSDWKYAYWTIKGQFGQSTLQTDPNRTGPQI